MRPSGRRSESAREGMNEEMPARRLRILCVCSASHWGGNEQWLSLAMAELAMRHEVYLCYRAPELAPRFPRAIEAFQAPFRGLWDIVTIRQLGRFIRELRIDLTIATRRLDYVVCGALARIMGIKNVLRLGIIRRPWMPIWHRLVYGRLNHGIIVNADGIREVLLDYLPIKPAKVRTIRNGVAVTQPGIQAPRSAAGNSSESRASARSIDYASQVYCGLVVGNLERLDAAEPAPSSAALIAIASHRSSS
jgi:hypothetical protein